MLKILLFDENFEEKFDMKILFLEAPHNFLFHFVLILLFVCMT